MHRRTLLLGIAAVSGFGLLLRRERETPRAERAAAPALSPLGRPAIERAGGSGTGLSDGDAAVLQLSERLLQRPPAQPEQVGRVRAALRAAHPDFDRAVQRLLRDEDDPRAQHAARALVAAWVLGELPGGARLPEPEMWLAVQDVLPTGARCGRRPDPWAAPPAA